MTAVKNEKSVWLKLVRMIFYLAFMFGLVLSEFVFFLLGSSVQTEIYVVRIAEHGEARYLSLGQYHAMNWLRISSLIFVLRCLLLFRLLGKFDFLLPFGRQGEPPKSFR